MSDPWLKFYTSDWRADPRLKMCSLEARGMWIEMICLMHEAEPYGQLLVSGQSPTDAQLAVLVGAPPDRITAMLGELESAGVFSRTRAGVIYSRKLSRMAKKSATARKNGKKGGNPTLSKERKKPPLVKGGVNGRDKPQKPEARDQIEEEYKSSSSIARDAREDEDSYLRYLKAHPRPIESAEGERAFDALTASGVDPEQIISAASAYAEKAKRFSTPDFVQQSDNFLDPERGKWRQHVETKAPPMSGTEKRALAEKMAASPIQSVRDQGEKLMRQIG